MLEVIGDSESRSDLVETTACALACVLDAYDTIFAGVTELRMLRSHPSVDDAVKAILEIAEIKRFVLSWELFALFAEEEGHNPLDVLHDHIEDEGQIITMMSAIYGEPEFVRDDEYDD
jgi:hypothetical protein